MPKPGPRRPFLPSSQSVKQSVTHKVGHVCLTSPAPARSSESQHQSLSTRLSTDTYSEPSDPSTIFRGVSIWVCCGS